MKRNITANLAYHILSKALWVRHCRSVLNMTDEEILKWCDKERRIKGKYVDLSDHLRQQG